MAFSIQTPFNSEDALAPLAPLKTFGSGNRNVSVHVNRSQEVADRYK